MIVPLPENALARLVVVAGDFASVVEEPRLPEHALLCLERVKEARGLDPDPGETGGALLALLAWAEAERSAQRDAAARRARDRLADAVEAGDCAPDGTLVPYPMYRST
jgi:hypothetical protein